MMKRDHVTRTILFFIALLMLITHLSCGTTREVSRERDRIAESLPAGDDERLTYIRSWFRNNPDSILKDEYLYYEAEILMQRREWEQAEKRYHEIVTRFPRSPRRFDAIHGLAVTHENLGRRAEALEQCEFFLTSASRLKRNIERKDKEYVSYKKEYRLQLGRSQHPDLNIRFRRFYAAILMREGRFEDALFQYRMVLRLMENNAAVTTADMRDVRYNTAMCYFGLHDVNRARDLLLLNVEQDLQQRDPQTLSIRDYVLLNTIYRATGEAYQAVLLYLDALQQPLLEADRLYLADTIADTIKREFTEQQLRTLIERYRENYPGHLALLNLLDVLEYQQRYQEAIEIIDRYSGEFTNKELSGKLLDRRNLLELKLTVDPYAIGFIAPLTGKFSPLGLEIARGARLAVMEYNQKASPTAKRFLLQELNSSGNPETIPGLIDSLIIDHKVIAIVGPVMSKSVENSVARLEHHGIAAITPATSEQHVARKSSGLFRNSLTNEQQIAALGDYLIRREGHRSFCILSTQMSVSQQLRDLFRAAVQQAGGIVKADITYPPETNDFSDYLRPLKHTSIDVFFIPDYPARVGEIAPQLRFHDFSRAIIAGANMLNSPDLIRIGGKYIERIIFPDDFIIESQRPELQEFTRQYTEAFGVAPTRYAAQAYDATRIIITAVLKGARTRASVFEYISKLENFNGVIGPLSMNEQGDLVRSVKIMTVRGGLITPVD